MTAQEAKDLRNAALTETDKLVLPDFPITPFGRWRAEAYRQQLRDWPESAGFPDVETMPKGDDWAQYKIPKEPTTPEGLEPGAGVV